MPGIASVGVEVAGCGPAGRVPGIASVGAEPGGGVAGAAAAGFVPGIVSVGAGGALAVVVAGVPGFGIESVGAGLASGAGAGDAGGVTAGADGACAADGFADGSAGVGATPVLGTASCGEAAGGTTAGAGAAATFGAAPTMAKRPLTPSIDALPAAKSASTFCPARMRPSMTGLSTFTSKRRLVAFSCTETMPARVLTDTTLQHGSRANVSWEVARLVKSNAARMEVRMGPPCWGLELLNGDLDAAVLLPTVGIVLAVGPRVGGDRLLLAPALG